MGITTRKGELGEAMVLADLQRKGYAVAIPFGHDLPFDLILIRRDGFRLEKVQCKYTESDGRVLDVRCGSTSEWVRHTYDPTEVDWLAVFDATTDQCFYLHSSAWDGLARPRLRLQQAANGQVEGIRWAADHTRPELLGVEGRRSPRASETCGPVAMLCDPAPE